MTALASHPAAAYRQPLGPEELPCLPPGIARAAELPGVVSIVLCRPTSESQVVRHLLAWGVPYYFPRVKRVRTDEQGRRRGTYWRAWLPGYLFVGDGLDGREAAAEYGRHFSGTVTGFLGFPGSETAGLRRDLDRVERAISYKSSPDCIDGLRIGVPVRVIQRGRWYGWKGEVESLDARDCSLNVNLPLFQQHFPNVRQFGPEDLEEISREELNEVDGPQN